MNIQEFFGRYKNHPILFIGSGMSQRYLENSLGWFAFLRKIASDVFDDEEPFLDLKGECTSDGKIDLPLLAKKLESKFNETLISNRHGKHKEINDLYYRASQQGDSISRFKLYISKILSELNYKPGTEAEIAELKGASKNISAIITTNYDRLCENIFEFEPLVGNKILLSNPYGSIYKIHGCVNEPGSIIITQDDYERFKKKYELIRTQLLSLFIHNPIIFLGYSVSDENITSILSTIFSYISPNSTEAERIRSNFLLIERGEGADADLILDHDVVVNASNTVRINKIKTNNFTSIYSALATLQLPVSALDVRKVQNVFKQIITQGNIKVSVADDLDGISNNEKILVVGSVHKVKYEFHNDKDLISNYFNIISSNNKDILNVIDKLTIPRNRWFPIKGFLVVNPDIKSGVKIRKHQEEKIKSHLTSIPQKCKKNFKSISTIMASSAISQTNKNDCIIYNLDKGNININDFEIYLKCNQNKMDSSYKKLLCFFDYKKYP